MKDLQWNKQNMVLMLLGMVNNKNREENSSRFYVLEVHAAERKIVLAFLTENSYHG